MKESKIKARDSGGGADSCHRLRGRVSELLYGEELASLVRMAEALQSLPTAGPASAALESPLCCTMVYRYTQPYTSFSS